MKPGHFPRDIGRQFAYFGRNYPQFDAVSNGIMLSFMRTGFLCKHFLGRRLKAYGLTGQAFGVLLTLETMPEKMLPMRAISRRLGVTQANVTGLVDTLEKRRLAARQTSSRDRRVTHVVLTAAGHQKVQSILPGHFKTIRELFGGFTAGERTQFGRLLDKFARALG